MTKTLNLQILLASVCLLGRGAAAQNELHPRLFFTTDVVDSIRGYIEVAGSHHQEAYEAMRARADQRDPRFYGTSPGYDESTLAKESALLYLITGDSTYAETAYEMLLLTMNMPEAAPTDAPRALTRAMTGMSMALAYDWCYNGWTDEQRTWTRDAIVRSLNEWTEFEHPKLGWGSGTNHVWEPFISNWVAVCQSAQIVMTLAVYEESSRALNVYRDTAGAIVYGLSRDKRYATLKSQLKRHVTLAYGNLGVTNEGNGYLGYGGSFLQPCLYVMPRAGEDFLVEEMARHEWWKFVMYTSSFDKDRSSLQNGVSNNDGVSGLGFSSLTLGTVPSADLPYYLHFYDRFMGVKSPRPPGSKYDEFRAGTLWALLMYPPHVQSKDPTGVLPPMVSDTVKGAFYFRNRWRDENDILASFMADCSWEKGIHNIPEAFQFNLIAHGNKYAGSPGRNYLNDLQSALFVDAKPYDDGHQRPASDTGTILYHEVTADGGYVIAGGGQKYSWLGVTGAERHFRVSFARGVNRAIVATLDKTVSVRSHAYSWQMNVGDEEGDRGLTVESGTESDRPYFLVRGTNGGYVKGWVLHPASARIEAADPLRIAVGGTNAEIFVAMLVDSGVPPTGTVAGTGMAGTLALGDVVVAYDASVNRIMAGDPTGITRAQGRPGPGAPAGFASVSYNPSTGRAFLVTKAAGSAAPSVTVHNSAGVRVRELAVPRQPGTARITWDCMNSSGRRVAPGSYILVYSAGAVRDVARLVVR